MAIHSNNIQEQIQEQRQSLSQYQIAFVRLLELPIEGVEERVRTELMENPALETVDDATESEMVLTGAGETDSFEKETDMEEDEAEEQDAPEIYATDIDEQDLEVLGDYRTLDDVPDYALADYSVKKEGMAEDFPFATAPSFLELLNLQLAESTLSPLEHDIAEYLIGSLDDDGLLRKSVDSIVEELAIYQGVYTTSEQVTGVLRIIQGFDPVGVGAQTLRECLILQLERKPDSIVKKHAMLILQRYYDDFSNKRWERILDGTDISRDMLDKIIEELTHLNPRPGSALSESVGQGQQGIIPDFIVYVDDEERVTFTLNEGNVPDLRVSSSFQSMMKEYQGEKETRQTREAILFLKQKMEAAQTFIDLIEQRRITMTSTMMSIVKRQKEFFVEGDECLLKPMLMKDVAEDTGLDISTISRVSSNKYVETRFGIFPLKFFFGDTYHKPVFLKQKSEQESSDEEALTQRKIKIIIQQCVEDEDKNAPLTDEQLMCLLKEKGFDLARRTVAKYRQQMGIPVARMRR